MLLLLITLLYAGYNLFVKVSGEHAAGAVTTTILATISLQTIALVVSLVFAAYLLMRGGQSFALPPASLKWAVLSGVCIGVQRSATFIYSRELGYDRRFRLARRFRLSFVEP